ncbi:fibrinogen-like YCDxxxxGGGW domain-containing protein [Glutamicibacter creatinolyticus]|uniref:fibrinogen-like YCDxxxxGGGW domain-containing protein n=1 Tax=Glutamicibacter creatinolyticus TaxID=162496 RepID=UPI0037C1B0A6
MAYTPIARSARTRLWALPLRLLTVAFLSVAMIATMSVLTPVPAAQADEETAAAATVDGLSQATAAASCWEIKQKNQNAPDGIYWLLTPTLVAPQEFYCDMTTDGGGWVLVGRGRQGWQTYVDGRYASRVSNPVAGTAAFDVAQLGINTVDGLLNNTRVDSLDDGIRLRRATDTAGTQWQEARFKPARWGKFNWTFPAEWQVASYDFAGSTGRNGTTNSFGNNNAYNRVDTNRSAATGWVWGFSYGSQVRGSTSSSSYLWSSTENGANARPFTQMYLRPKLMTDDLEYPQIDDQGSASIEQAPLAESTTMATTWGVNGLGNGAGGELNTEVQAFAQVGDRVFVGGNFRYVQTNRNGANRVEQRFIAAFNVNTGQYISTFTPTLNNPVKTMTALPDGRLAIGGQFSTVNGEQQASLAFIDPNTGKLSGDQVTVENRSAGGMGTLRNLKTEGDYLYLAGSFTHLTKRGSSTTASAWNGGRVNLNNGNPDTNWNPLLNGTAVGLHPSKDNPRTYFSGFFRMSGQTATVSAAAISTEPGASVVQPVWQPTFSRTLNDNLWQYALAEADGRAWLGGSEHSLFSYDTENFELLSGNITKNGGDFQYMHVDGDVAYAGCHCDDWAYSNAFAWPSVGNEWTSADAIGQVGAWNTETGEMMRDFSPMVIGRAGYGVWATFTDSLGRLWVGGDYTDSVRLNTPTGFANQWSGGFMRFAPRDAQAPTVPGTVQGTHSVASTELRWDGSTDDRGTVTYEVLREDRVIETTTATNATVPNDGARYFVRAADPAGNRSASTAMYKTQAPDPDALTLIELGSEWSWRYEAGSWDGDWNTRDYDSSSWATGAAPLGRGTGSWGTNIMPAALSPVPLSVQFIKSIQIEDASQITDGKIAVRADDGVVVYVNGVEVGRQNLPPGNLGQNSYATAAPRSSTAAANLTVFEVPSAVLRDGANVVAASTHANYRSTLDLSFDLAFTAVSGDAEVPDPPATPEVSAEAASGTTVQLQWSQPASDVAVERFEISRDGEPLAEVAADANSYLDEGLTPETTYEYAVVAVGEFGRRSEAGTVSVQTPADLSLSFIEEGSEWQWRYDSAAWDSNWNAIEYDASTWGNGQAPLGRGAGSWGTNIMPEPLSPLPISAQFRKSIEIEDASQVVDGLITVRADDGVVVYVNGVEVGRQNMPETSLGQNSYATAVPRTSSAAANPVQFEVPSAVLRNGQNVVAASTHGNYRSTPDLSFELGFTATRGRAEIPDAPQAPVVSAHATSTTTVEVSWTEPEAETGISRYVLSRDGAHVADLASDELSYTDEGLEPDTAYEYSVVAVGQFGRSSEPGTASVRTTADTSVTLIENGADWAWRYDSATWDPLWSSATFDDSAWARGTAPLGRGPGTWGTNIMPEALSPIPLSAQFRTTVEIDDPQALVDPIIRVRADDGVVVYVNGVEIGRRNLPSGNLGQNSYATAAPRTTASLNSQVEFEVPRELLQAGNNVVAVSTHANYRSTPDLSFDLLFSAEQGQ